MRLVAETLMKARTSILDQIKVLDRRLSAVARATPMVRLFMTAPGVGVITALSVASVFDDASRFRRSSSAGAYLGLDAHSRDHQYLAIGTAPPGSEPDAPLSVAEVSPPVVHYPVDLARGIAKQPQCHPARLIRSRAMIAWPPEEIGGSQAG